MILRKQLDNNGSLAAVKLLWLHRIRLDHQDYAVDLVDITEPPRFVTTITASADQLRTHIDGFIVEIRRAFINDLYLTVARFGVIVRNVIEGIEPAPPEFHDTCARGRGLGSGYIFVQEEKRFLDFFRKLRNATVHYNGNHNRCGALDFKFNGTYFHTHEGNIGQQIGYWFSDLFAIQAKLKEVFAVEKIVANPHLLHLLGSS